jgi:adenylate cyclase
LEPAVRSLVDLSGELLDHLTVVVQACTEAGSRFVKMIGDAAMFVSPDAEKVLVTAGAIMIAISGYEDFPAARIGIDSGNVLPLGGDYYGPAVNTAARITGFARPGTIVASKALLEAVHDDTLSVSKLGAHRLKGVGKVSMYKVRLDDPEPAD